MSLGQNDNYLIQWAEAKDREIDKLKAENLKLRKALRDIESAWFSQRPSDIIKIVDKVFEWRDSK